jgi:hypothetical protein
VSRRCGLHRFNFDNNALQKLGVHDFVSPTLDMHRLGQFMAKIAHAMSVATLGVEGFKPYLLELIRNKSVPPYEFVGGLAGKSPTTNSVHSITNRLINIENRLHVTAEVQVFSCLGAPVYQVVVGEKLNAPPPPWLKTPWKTAADPD